MTGRVENANASHDTREPSPVPGRLVVVSGPSGAGKTTLLARLFDRLPHLVRSVSATTRPARPSEREGVDYYFLSSEDFARRRDAGDFLETCEVFGRGHWYGTLKSEVTPSLAAGKWVVLEIDVAGTRAVLQHYPSAITIFVRPSSTDELARRLRARGTESEDAISRRLEVARQELAAADIYRFHVENDDLDRAVEAISQILTPDRG